MGRLAGIGDRPGSPIELSGMAITNVRQDQLPLGAGTAAPVVPVPAASILLLRDAPLRVLMIRRHFESIASFRSADELIASRRGATIATMRPILVMRDGQQTIVLPDEGP